MIITKKDSNLILYLRDLYYKKFKQLLKYENCGNFFYLPPNEKPFCKI
jgi:hypothetical protein